MLNVATLMGRLTAEPELRYTPSNIPVTTFTLAVNRSYAKAGTERQTDFINIVAWRSTAEFVTKYFHKGQLVAVEGQIQTRSYQDKQGINRRAFEVVASNVHFAEAKREQQGNNNFNQATPEEANEPSEAYTNATADDFAEITSDDDLPF